jgi:succinoglycan biosynthesis transport protein ExoP
VELRNYLQALRKSRLLLALLTVVGLAVGVGLFLVTPPTYSSNVTFYVSTPLEEGTNPLSAGQFAEARVNSYVSLLSSESLAQRVIEDRDLDLTKAQVAKMIDASAQVNTVLVTADVTSADSAESLSVAQGVANTFGDMVDGLDNKGRKAPTVVINVVSGPTLAPAPVAPNPRLYAGLGLLAGLLLGALVAVLREMLDTTVRSTETASNAVKAPTIGNIGYDVGVKKKPLIVGSEIHSVRGEAFRQLRTNLQFIQASKSADVLLVTSSVPQEGKSTTAVNLALSFVELGHRVLLVEADLRRPRIARYLGIQNEVGLTNVLIGQVEFEDVIQPWGGEGLSVLPSGAIPPNPAELLGSPKMLDLVKKLRANYDEVIIDTPPLLPVTDAAVCSGVVDGVVVVVRWGKTQRTQLKAAVDSLRAVDAQVLGVVLSMRKVSRSERRRYAMSAYGGPGKGWS